MLHVILSSCPAAAADAIARGLVEQRVAACVSALPGAVSTYRWQGAVQCEPETLLVIKAPEETLEACMAALVALHPYDVPEVVAWPAQRVADSYLAWALAACDVPGPI